MHQSFAALLLLGGLMYAQQPKAPCRRERPHRPLSVDLKGHRVFLAALGNETLEVLDVKNGRRLQTIPNLAEPQGLYYDDSSNRVFVACRKYGTTRLLDAASFRVLDTVKFAGDADNVRYDGRERRIIVGYGDGALGLLDLAGKKLGDIPLDAHPESFQLEKSGNPNICERAGSQTPTPCTCGQSAP